MMRAPAKTGSRPLKLCLPLGHDQRTRSAQFAGTSSQRSAGPQNLSVITTLSPKRINGFEDAEAASKRLI
jgi:hypothetical protein